LRYSCGHLSTKKNVKGIKDAAASTPRSCVVVDLSDIAIISVIPDIVKATISGITNTPQKTYSIAQ
jgi:protein gp37